LTRARSPLREVPLRVAGQSTDRQITRLVIDEGWTFVSIAVFMLSLTAYEWARWFFKTPPQPWLVTVLAVLVLTYSMYRLGRLITRLRTLKLGRDGERAVAEVLDELKSEGAVVFHDILGRGFNIDHVVLSKYGIYALETKTFSKKPGAEASFDGKMLLLDGRTPGRDPLAQAIAAADWIRTTLKTMTARNYPVRPVVVLPGWYVRLAKDHDRSGVWVLNPKMLAAFVTKDPPRVSEDDLRLAVFCLARYVKSTPEEE